MAHSIEHYKQFVDWSYNTLKNLSTKAKQAACMGYAPSFVTLTPNSSLSSSLNEGDAASVGPVTAAQPVSAPVTGCVTRISRISLHGQLTGGGWYLV